MKQNNKEAFKEKGEVVLYDLTSFYLDGRKN